MTKIRKSKVMSLLMKAALAALGLSRRITAEEPRTDEPRMVEGDHPTYATLEARQREKNRLHAHRYGMSYDEYKRYLVK